MKHAVLRSIAHNIADSLATGLGFPIGMYVTDIFAEAEKSPDGFITVDFLNGKIEAGTGSRSLAKAVALYGEALPELCKKQGGSVIFFRELTARYSDGRIGGRVCVTIEDDLGRRSTDEYYGLPLQHMKITDGVGRIRTKRR